MTRSKYRNNIKYKRNMSPFSKPKYYGNYTKYNKGDYFTPGTLGLGTKKFLNKIDLDDELLLSKNLSCDLFF